jgi:hypothetical protein
MGSMCESDEKFEERNAKIKKAAAKDGNKDPVFIKRPLKRELTAWRDGWASGEIGGTPKGMDRSRQANLASNHKVDVVKKIASAIKDNDESPLSEVSLRVLGYNGVSGVSEAVYAHLGGALHELSELSDETALPIVEKFREAVAQAYAIALEEEAKAEAEEMEKAEASS